LTSPKGFSSAFQGDGFIANSAIKPQSLPPGSSGLHFRFVTTRGWASLTETTHPKHVAFFHFPKPFSLFCLFFVFSFLSCRPYVYSLPVTFFFRRSTSLTVGSHSVFFLPLLFREPTPFPLFLSSWNGSLVICLHFFFLFFSWL